MARASGLQNERNLAVKPPEQLAPIRHTSATGSIVSSIFHGEALIADRNAVLHSVLGNLSGEAEVWRFVPCVETHRQLLGRVQRLLVIQHFEQVLAPGLPGEPMVFQRVSTSWKNFSAGAQSKPHISDRGAIPILADDGRHGRLVVVHERRIPEDGNMSEAGTFYGCDFGENIVGSCASPGAIGGCPDDQIDPLPRLDPGSDLFVDRGPVIARIRTRPTV